MLELATLEAVDAEDEDYTLHIRVKKTMALAFIKTFEGLQEISSHLALKFRQAEAQTEKAREAWEREKEERFNRIKADIREIYKAKMADLKDHKKALKATRAAFRDYWFLVNDVREEIRTAKDLEILRLSNGGLNSKEIGRLLKLHHGTVRKYLSRLNGPQSSERAGTSKARGSG